MSVFIGTGTTIAFGTSGFSAEILDVTPPGGSRESIQTSHMGTTDAHTFTPAKLVDWGELSFDIHFDPATTPPIGLVAETITITFPNSAATTWAFTGFCTGYESADPLEGKMTGTITVKVSGDVTIS